ncbi:MAG: cellulose synthase/poly-beta-1,6-N-acetylglucosamine synthase-like glycosyltransferase [Polaribacter sp.]
MEYITKESMTILVSIYIIIASILILFLVLPFGTVFLSLFVKEKILRRKDGDNDFQQYDYGCIITAYKNAEIAKPLIHSLLKQPYQNLHIYLVADECDISEFDLSDEKLTVFRPDPSLRLKAKSIIHAMENYVRPHEYTVVFDADNLAHPDFLLEINQYANNGYRSIQGQRTAKNLDTPYACADATGEFYKNYIDRYAPYLIGSSAVISGSGMAVETNLYWEYLRSPEIEQGKKKWKKMLQEDKILQNFLLSKNERIGYAWDAIVYDEKVVSGEQVETQRGRWLYSYFQNLPNSSGHIVKGLFSFSWNRFFFGLVTINLPLFILLFLSGAMMTLGLLLSIKTALALFVAIVIFCLTIIWTLYLSKVPKAIWTTLWGLPMFVVKQVTALFKMGNPNKNFKESKHTRSYSIDEVLKNEKEN